MKKAKKSTIPNNISEEYYQLGAGIMDSFPKYRPPIDLFKFRDDIGSLELLFRKGERLSNEQVEEMHKLCVEGDLFVSRSDHPIYSQHIVKQLDLVLMDKNLKESEIADIIQRALAMRLNDFFSQPVKAFFDPLYADTMVFTEFLVQDQHRIKLFMRRLVKENSLINHSLNSLWVGLWILLNSPSGGEVTRKEIDHCAIGLLLHDVGMSKVPQFITSKEGGLKPDEKDKLPGHPVVSLKIIQKMEADFEEARQAAMEHHERLDGSGYPQKIKKISRIGRIVGVADSFCAMTANRPYAPAKNYLQAAQELTADRTRYDNAFSSALAAAYATNAFGLKKPGE